MPYPNAPSPLVGVLTPGAGPLVPGTTYKNLSFIKLPRIDGGPGSPITLSNCLIDGQNIPYAVHGSFFILDRCEIKNAGVGALVQGTQFTVSNSYCHTSESDGFKAMGNCVIDSNFITGLGSGAGAHADGVQIGGASNILITNNNFSCLNDREGNRALMAQFAGLGNITFSGNMVTGQKNSFAARWSSSSRA